MKIYLIISLILGSFSGLLSQYEIEWEVKIRENQAMIFSDLIKTSDDNFLLLSHDRLASTNKRDLHLFNLSSEGQLIWEKTYGGSENETARSCIETPDGYFIFGDTESSDGDVSQNSGEEDVWIVKVNKTGDIIWEKTIGDTINEQAYNGILASDGGVALLHNGDAFSGQDSSANFSVHLTKMDTDGNLAWSSELMHPDGYMFGETLALDMDGNYLVTSYLLSFTTFGIQSILFKVSKSGEVIWVKKIEKDGLNYGFSTIKSLANNDILLGGYNDHEGLIVRLDSLGNEIWQKTIGGLGAEFISDFEITNEENIVAIGYSNSDELGLEVNDREALIFELDSEGNMLWYDTFGGPLDQSLSKIESHPNGGYLIGGVSGFDLVIYKINITSTSSTDLDTKSTLRLYPNPSSDKITINVPPDDLGSTYKIYNSLGQECRSGSIQSTYTVLDVSRFSVGEYTFKIANEKTMSSIQFVKY